MYFDTFVVFPWALESWAGYNVTIYGDPDVIKKYPNTEHAFCIVNHRGDLDWMIGWIVIERIGMLGVRRKGQPVLKIGIVTQSFLDSIFISVGNFVENGKF